MTSEIKRLWILRHGKSDWQASYAEDRERPLKARGKRAARAAGELLAVAGARLDRVWVSTAQRTRQTAQVALEGLASETTDRSSARPIVDFRDSLYLAEPESVIAELGQLSDNTGEILLVGHEPTCSGLLSTLVGGQQGATFAFPTAALAHVEILIDDWACLGASCGRLKFLIPPRLWMAKRSLL